MKGFSMWRAAQTCLLAIAPVVLAIGCASYQMTNASISLPSELTDYCVAASLQAEAHVVGFREVLEGIEPSYSFQIADPIRSEKQRLAFFVRQKWGEAEGKPQIEMSATFRARLWAAKQRVAAIEQQQAMLSRVIERCAGREPEFGDWKTCGKGEKNTLCVRGKLP